MHIRDIEKRRRILTSHMLLEAKEKIDNIVFTCAILQHAQWQVAGRGHDVAGDFPEYSMDHRIIYLRGGPADRSYVGSDNIDVCDVEVECE